MTNLKSILLGTGAAIVAATTAQAADLPIVEPVDYVQICDTYGNGYFFIPGTNTCIQFSGYVRFQAVVGEDVVGPLGGGLLTGSPFSVRNQDRVFGTVLGQTFTVDDNDESTFAFGAAGQFNVDTRTETEFGTLRGFLKMEGGTDFGGFAGSPSRDNENSVLADIAAGGDDIAFEIDEAYVQFDIGPGFITAGLAPSFAGVSGPSSVVDTPFTSGGGDNFLIGYTLDIGPAQVGVALEDTFDRTRGFGVQTSSVDPVTGIPFRVPFVSANIPGAAVVQVVGQDGLGQDLPVLSAFARFSLADIVNLRVAGAVGDTNEAIVRIIDTTTGVPVLLERKLDDEVGFALAASAGTTFSFLNLGVGGTYAEGLVEFAIDGGAFETDFFITGALPVAAVRTPANTLAALDIDQVEAFAVYANVGFEIASYGVNFIAAYGEIEYPVVDERFGDTAEAFTLAANVNVSPVDKLDLIAEVFYQDIEVDANLAPVTGTNAVFLEDDGGFEEDAIGVVFRIQRNF